MSPLQKRWDWLRGGISRHYGDDELLAFHDGEISLARTRKIAAHLNGCAFCRGKAALLEGDLRTLTEIDAALVVEEPPSDDIVNRLQNAIRTWNTTNRVDPAFGGPGWPERTVLGPDICAELAVYLGSHALDLILQDSIRKAYDGRKLLEAVSTVLQNFLGPRASEALVRSLQPLSTP